MKKLFSKSLTVAAFALTTLLAGQANASVISGGSKLLSDANVSQLTTWLGQGSIGLTNIFTKKTGNTASDFHAAADGKGATFVVMQVTTSDGATGLIGGYNPLSWTSKNQYNVVTQANATGFLFNLTSNTKFAERKDASGQYQTYNLNAYGPTFGGGHDLYVGGDLTTSYSYSYSYGKDYGYNLFGSRNMWQTISGLEVFSISADTGSAVPEPESLALVALGLAGLAFMRRKAKKA